MLVTLDTSQVDRSWLKLDALINIAPILVTLETFQDERS
ncbi:uncharacterized protein METZ01_LOCUS216825 [marine metagenome]|uniref:Uncharacterized protein n=1 Tax=marine metagenome TaxID=408172 RepID=A0A382FPS0_9ZZZZ